jgi:hypothetical protein
MFSASKSKGASGSYQIANSLRFRSSASAYLNRTPSVAGNRQIWTWSGWVKRGALGAAQILFGAAASPFGSYFRFESGGTLRFYDYNGTTFSPDLITTQVFRDPSSWYHLVLVSDTTQATSTNRIRMYVNGTQITAFSTATYPAQNAQNTSINNTYPTTIGAASASLDGYLADVNFIDGQALTPTSFGAFDPVTGVWTPKKYSGTYGTNGFKLNFSNGTSTTTLGYDSSGNSNNWTTNNISLTAGSTYDWMIDSPTPFAGTSYGVGNYCTLNPLKSNSASGLALGNLYQYIAIANWTTTVATIGVSSGKWYWEQVYTNITAGTYGMAGIVDGSFSIATANYPGITATSYGYFNSNGYKYNNAGSAAYGATYTNNDIIGVALDLDAGTLTFYKNNVSQGVAFTGLSGTFFPALSTYGSVATINFGQRPFAYTPPTGFKALNTQNLPAASIANGANYMAATTYTGTGATQSISNIVNGVGFQPDFVWAKQRGVGTDHVLYDVIRTGTYSLTSNNTAAEVNQTSNGCTVAFASTGFTAGADTAGYLNYSGRTYVGWQWKANGTAVSNTAGSITSQVSANTTSGFSVVTYTGDGVSTATIGHGLGVAPSMVIFKSRSVALQGWYVYHTYLGVNQYIRLDTTAAAATITGLFSPVNSSVIGINGAYNAFNNNGGTYVAYCFAAIAGYSAFGSYTGNGSTDGPFIYTGFRPRFVMTKRSDAAGEYWIIHDTARDPSNVATNRLYPNVPDAEAVSVDYDILSNGFKLRVATNPNNSGGTYIYAAFAESPFQNALAR